MYVSMSHLTYTYTYLSKCTFTHMHGTFTAMRIWFTHTHPMYKPQETASAAAENMNMHL